MAKTYVFISCNNMIFDIKYRDICIIRDGVGMVRLRMITTITSLIISLEYQLLVQEYVSVNITYHQPYDATSPNQCDTGVVGIFVLPI